jgi:type VI secretion system protein VasJ
VSSLLETLRVRTAPLRAPIAGDAKVGADISLEPDFEVVKSEIDCLSNLSGKAPDWRTIRKISTELLSTRTKDLRLAAWRALAQQQLDGWSGLADGVVVLHDIASDYWDDSFPPVKRARGRASLFTWLGDQLKTVVVTMQVTGEDSEHVRLVESMFASLDASFEEKLAGAYAGIGPLRSALREKLREIPEEAAPTEGAVEPEGGAREASAGTTPGEAGGGAGSISIASTAAPRTVANMTEAIAAVKTQGASLVQLAGNLRRSDPAHAFPYRLARAAAWLAIDSTPKSQGDRTTLEAPPAGTRARLLQLRGDEEWADLLALTESSFPRYTLWLDLQRFAAIALERHGGLFVGAANAIGRESVALIARLPRLLELEFADGSRLCDEETRAWLDAEARRHDVALGPADRTHLDDRADIQMRFQRANELAAAGDIPAAVGVAYEIAERAPDARTRFLQRIALVRLTVKHGAHAIGTSVLEHLVNEADERRLDAWEPRLAAQLYICQLDAARARGEDPDRGIVDKLCRIDPASALRYLTTPA